MKVWRFFKNQILKKTGIQALLNLNEKNFKNELETRAAITFTNAIQQCNWLEDKAFFPGGWAVEYSFLLTLYRILNHYKFCNILEFGLGQSSKIIHQYANFYKIQATTVEHDDNWISFFLDEIHRAYPIHIKNLALDTINYKGFETLSYKNIEETFAGSLFDLIIVDGPFGSKKFSRSQIIDIVKFNIRKTFCIIIDDTDRVGEKETINEIFKILKSKNTPFFSYEYTSLYNHTVICSEDLKFFSSLQQFTF